MIALIALYCAITLTIGVCALSDWAEDRLSSSPKRQKRAQDAAQVALMCWAWPIWLLVGLGVLVNELIRSALGRKP